MGTLHALQQESRRRYIIPDGLPLTQRDMECIRLIADGLNNKEIAWRQNVTHETAKGRIKRIMREVPTITRTELVVVAFRAGWLDPYPTNERMRSWKPSKRMQELLTHLVSGLSNQQIAWRMCLSYETVKSNMAAMLLRLGLRSRTLLARVALQEGWVK